MAYKIQFSGKYQKGKYYDFSILKYSKLKAEKRIEELKKGFTDTKFRKKKII